MMDYNVDLREEMLPVDDLVPYENNARKHGEEDVEAIVNSIKRFGFVDPIGIWKENIIVEGHGRLEAAKKLGMKEVPVIHLDHLSDEERRAYALAHNKTAELSAWDFDKLDLELEDIDFDMSEFGFEIKKDIEEISENPYTKNVKIPQYEPIDEDTPIKELVDTSKCDALIERIRNSNADEETKRFLEIAAYRHNVFDYKRIANFYAQASEEVQRLMEEQALVIIDVNDAIANGYAVFSNTIEEIAFGDEE